MTIKLIFLLLLLANVSETLTSNKWWSKSFKLIDKTSELFGCEGRSKFEWNIQGGGFDLIEVIGWIDVEDLTGIQFIMSDGEDNLKSPLIGEERGIQASWQPNGILNSITVKINRSDECLNSFQLRRNRVQSPFFGGSGQDSDTNYYHIPSGAKIVGVRGSIDLNDDDLPVIKGIQFIYEYN